MKFKTLYKKGSNKTNVLFSFLNKTPNFEKIFVENGYFHFHNMFEKSVSHTETDPL